LKALSKLGVKYKIVQGYIYARASKGLIGNVIKFPKISVGATENLIIAASLAKGKTTLKNCAIEPEIEDLVNFLRKMGCNIKWSGKRTITILGVKLLREVNYKIMFDRIEAGTYMIASALTEGKLKIINIIPKKIKTEIDILKKVGAIKKIKNIKLTTAPYPGFPTDLQAQLMVLLCKSFGRSEIIERIFENRFMHASELNRMGAKIKILGNKAIIEGNVNFKEAELMATDLRASVSLILAALTARGKSIVNRIYHLDRGYENIEQKLRSVGAKIRRIS
jgi:UDP-N-acetylglucosamine 1-carboxyvinyltransferase